jgi:outer membrane receptor protein involved in Fe transport
MASLLLGAAPMTMVAAQSPASELYDLPSQPLAKSVLEVSRRSGRTLVAPSQLLDGLTAPALRGRFAPGAALDALLAGSGLEAERVKGGFVIRRGDRISDNESPIVVTGTLVRGAQPTSPLIRIGRDEIERSGATSVEQLLRDLPQNFQGGVNQENFFVPGAGADITEHGAGLNLRGLGQRATLVLVNGRRLAPSGVGSFVDVSMIPVSALERVEILTDGASAIYGSDAVGGVVNFILKDRFEGIETLAQAGTSTGGGGTQLLAGATAGTAWSGGRAMISYEFRREGEIRAKQRSNPVGLDQDHYLVPGETRHSLFGVVSQSLSDRLELEISGSHARRDTKRSYFFTSSDIPVDARAKARSTGLGMSLHYDAGGSWRAELGGQYFLSRTRQVQQQPGGQGLVNRLNTRNSLAEARLKVDGNLFELPAGPVKLAVGVEGRREAYRDLFETQVNAPAVRKDRRLVGSLFGEAYVPLFSAANRRPGLERLLLTAAGRYGKYQGLEASFDPKLGILWSPVRGVSLRSSFDTSFRAPLLSETTGFYNAFYFPAAYVYVDPSEAPAGASLALVGSNPDIQPERSRTWTLGLDVEPPAIPGLKTSLNYYSIRFSDRIALPTNQVVVVGDPALEPIVTRDPALGLVTSILDGAGQVLDFSGPGFTNGGAAPGDVRVIVDARFNNSAETRTRGLDLLLQYDFKLGGSQLGATLNVNHVLSFDNRLTRTSPAAELLDVPYQPLDWRVNAALHWSRGPWEGSVSAHYAGAYRDDRFLPVRKISSFTTLDASLAYESKAASGPLAGTRLSFFVANLLGSRPPRLRPDPGDTTGVGYDPVNASIRGRQLSLQLRKSW